MKLADLSAEFPRDAIHWRAQTLTRNGDKALALAYLDARDVMDRLDNVCGPENWQSRYVETAKGRVLCEIGIKVGDEWVWKSDGAGDTAVEGEKGGISDALKRAAVQWGIGRYLYRLDAVWAPCETYQKGDKLHWKAWKGSPWDHVRGRASPKAEPQQTAPQGPPPEAVAAAKSSLENADSLARLKGIWDDLPNDVRAVRDIINAKDMRKGELTSQPANPEAAHDAAVKDDRNGDLDGDHVPFQ